jgi:23S rRNA (cytidine1920-2'-O)/16S rRNA (cytidine1409-2'-O)-methyltransferase
LKKQRFVSRGGDKLFNAIKKLNIDVRYKHCLDVGAATGGFSDCLIQLGAKDVVAIDVGSNQLHASLRQHPQIRVYEKTNINNVNPNDFSNKFDIIVVDVSFTSLKVIFDRVIQHLKSDGEILWLFKPQFEVGKEFLNKKGIVKQEQVVHHVLKETTTKLQAQGFKVTIIKSDLKGKQGNQEYFLHIKQEQHVITINR